MNNDPFTSQIAWFFLNNTGDAVIALDCSGAIQSWNPAAEKIFGYTMPEVAGRPFISLFARGIDGIEPGVLEEKLNAGSSTSGWDTTQVHKNGSVVHTSLDICPLFAENGALAGNCVIGKETTRFRMLQSQLRQTQKLEAVGRLSGGIAHDFNNLLMIIAGYNGMIMAELPAEDPVLPYAVEIAKASERAAMLTNQLLAFSRREVTKPRVLNLNETIADLDKMLRRIIGEDVELILHLATGLSNIKADPGQIGQLLTNLVINARDAMPDGGVVTIATEDVDVAGADRAGEQEIGPGAYVSLTVADSGTGMDEETRQHLFEPFFTTKPRGEGTGLGLSIVSGIVSQLRGDIQVSTELGKGTKFTIRLPVTAEQQTDTRSIREITPKPDNREITVLLVEDDSGVRHLIRHMLLKGGYTVYETSDPEEAARICEAVPIKLLMTDIVMPGTGGRDLAGRLMKCHRDLRVLYMSGYISDSIFAGGFQEPGLHFIRKPFSAAHLYQHIQAIFDATAYEGDSGNATSAGGAF
jgi:PAS domain S-box-containing protein